MALTRFVLFILLLFSCLFFTSCVTEQKYSETRNLMGTEVTIIIYDSDNDKSALAAENAFSEIMGVEELMSTYINDSQLSQLNKEKFLDNPDKDLVFVINRSIYFSDISYGAFDVTVQPLLDLYTNSFSKKSIPPSDEKINEYLERVNYQNIVLSNKRILLEENSSITLGGIAKGYALDKAINSLFDSGITNALVNAGGDIRAVGKKPDSEWNTALQNPRDKTEFITIIELDNISVATSGDYERYFDEEMKAHHIMDPRTGKSALGVISATVITKKGINADALATTIFVLGAEEGMNLLEKINNAEGLVITDDREIIRSSGFDKFEIR